VSAALLEVRELDASAEPVVAPALTGDDSRDHSFRVEPQLVVRRSRHAKADLNLVTDSSLARALDQHAARRKIDDLFA
jgi:hypothetical protein